ncbi:MAG: V-type ATPase subunit [Woeseiaceae bacterium]|nr:V-type ATPase subunit [Woeseiaceae bacterium]
MSAIADYAYLNCRVSIRAEGLLPSSRLAELHTLPSGQVTDILREAGFFEVADDPPQTTRELEQALIRDYLDDIGVLLRPLKGAARAFLSHWMHRYEIINLKRCIRHHMQGLPPADLRENLIDMGPTRQLPIDELVQAENAEEALRKLEGSAYAAMARRARDTYEERHNLFDLEAVLDSNYYRGLFDCYDDLPDSDRRSLATLLGTLADQLNLVWLLRYRFVFGLAPPHAYLLLVPPGLVLKRAHLLSLVQMEKLGDVLKALPESLQPIVGSATSIVQVEKAMDKRTQREAYRVLKKTSFNLARPLAYLVLRERQILKVHVALKGRLLKLEDATVVIAATLPDSFLEVAAA